MSEELTDKFRADIQISRGRTGKPNPMLLTICANDAEALCDRLAAAESSAAQALREREVLEGALRELTDALTNTWFVGGRSGGKSILAEAWDKANVLLASLPTEESA